jgi:hypothetical protein
MSAYTIVLFVHIAAAFALMATVGIQTAGTFWLRRARRVEQVRDLAGRMLAVARVFPVILLTILAAGLYLAITAWGLQTAWIDVALVTFLILSVAAPVLHAPRGAALKRAAEAAPDGPLPPELAALTRDPVLLGSHLTFAWLTLGILFLMTNKPALGGSIVVMLVALLLGLAACIPLRRRQVPDAAHVVRKANAPVEATQN